MDKNFDLFVELVKDQFSYGGQKYAHDKQREATDILFDAHGKNWLFGTIDKYTHRFRNLARERDLLKIATYMFILWLKRGFHFANNGLEKPVDTTVETKDMYFPLFIKTVKELSFRNAFNILLQVLFVSLTNYNKNFTFDNIFLISDYMRKFSEKKWVDISENEVIIVFNLAYEIWKEKYAFVKEHDKDTYNEKQRT